MTRDQMDEFVLRAVGDREPLTPGRLTRTQLTCSLKRLRHAGKLRVPGGAELDALVLLTIGEPGQDTRFESLRQRLAFCTSGPLLFLPSELSASLQRLRKAEKICAPPDWHRRWELRTPPIAAAPPPGPGPARSTAAAPVVAAAGSEAQLLTQEVQHLSRQLQLLAQERQEAHEQGIADAKRWAERRAEWEQEVARRRACYRELARAAGHHGDTNEHADVVRAVQARQARLLAAARQLDRVQSIYAEAQLRVAEAVHDG